MKVKKLKDEWQPAENPGLQIGETIEVTNPRTLIEAGLAIGVDEFGNELTAFELYGTIQEDDRKKFEEWLSVQKQEKIQAKLEAEQAVLAQQLTEQPVEEKEEASVEPVVTTPEPVAAEPVAEEKKEELSPEEVTRQKRLAALAKAREARGK
jgi:hypothetical protein